jgi:hypothetical protein
MQRTLQSKIKFLIVILLMGMFGSSAFSQTIVEDFETGDFSFLDWEFEGTPDAWKIEEASLNGGLYAASANAVAFNDNVFMTVTQTFAEPGQISFDIQQTENNIFIFEIEGIITFYTPGFIVGTDVRQEVYDVPAGTYKISFGSYNIGSVGEPFTMKDSVFIDNITFSAVEPVENTARVQLIHNSADAAAEVVDVWLNDSLLIDDFAFRTASPYMDLPAQEEFTIAIKEADSVNPDNPLWTQEYTLEGGETYVLIASGIVSPSGYFPSQPFDIYVFESGREEAATTSGTDILVFHGSTDAPIVDIYESGMVATEIIDDLAYEDFDGYLELETSDYIFELRNESGAFVYAAYEASLASFGFEGLAITVLASGFFNPGVNSLGAPFGLWAALPEGGDLIPFPLVSFTGLDEKPFSGRLAFYPNPASHSITIDLELDEASDIQLELLDVSGRVFHSVELKNRSLVNNFEMDVSSIPEGVYFLRISTASGRIVKKVMVSS